MLSLLQVKLINCYNYFIIHLTDGSAGSTSGQSASAKLKKVKYYYRLIYLLYIHSEDQADTFTEDSRSRESDKVDVSEKSGESKVYKTDIKESSNSEDKGSSFSNTASDTESPSFAPSPGFESYPAVPSVKIERGKKPEAGTPYGALSNSVPTTLGNIENISDDAFVDPLDISQQETGRPYGALSNSVQTRLGNLYEKPREEHASYQQEVGSPDGALSLSNSVQSRLGNTMFYHELPVTVSGGYSYNSG